jgi:ubiquinone/menaquinone biosynthesis C-methylase UbiE
VTALSNIDRRKDRPMTSLLEPAATPAPDLAAIKQRQQATWASGDYHRIATQIQLMSELTIEALDVRSSERVLDVATGSGNAAIAAARRGASVVGVDYVPALLDRARVRAAAEELSIEFVEGDAEALPFPGGAFDVTVSVVGAMFAPDPVRTARELVRVTRPGGRIGLASWTPTGFIGQVFKANGRHVPPPVGLRSPLEWGTAERLRELFGDAIAELRVERRQYTFRAASPQAWIDDFRTWYGPMLKAFDTVGRDGAGALEADLLEVIARFDRADDGTVVLPSEYLESVIVTR